jgi:molecular chaperone Hsp33
MAQYEGAKAGLEGKAAVFGGGRLALTFENLATGQIYQSLVPLEGAGMAEIFENYLQRSEQRTSFLRLFAGEAAVCGLMLEKLPGAEARDPDGWSRVTHLAGTLTLAESVNVQPYELLVRLFPEELLRVFRLDAVTYHCPFNVENVERVLRGLGRAEVESILAEQGEVVVKNEMCNHEYRFNRDDVEALFA